MGVPDLWTKFLQSDAEWPKVAAIVIAGTAGVWSWATNKPDPETGKKSMLKSIVTIGALSTGTALGITKLRKTSIRQAIRTMQDEGFKEGVGSLFKANNTQTDTGQSL